MDLYWSIERSRLIVGIRSTVALTGLQFKRRDGADLRLYFVRDDGSIVERPSTTEIRFAIKKQGDFAGEPLVLESGFVEQPDFSWLASPNLNTTQLNAFFTPPNVASKAASAEITFRDSETGRWTSSQTLDVTIFNDLIQGDEGTPTNAEEPENYLTATQSNARFLRYDAAQSLDSTQRSQVLTNLGIASVPVIYSGTFSVSRDSNGTTHGALISLPPGTYSLQLLGSLFYTIGSATATVSAQLSASNGSTPFDTGTAVETLLRYGTTHADSVLTQTNSPTTSTLADITPSSLRGSVSGAGRLVVTATADLRLSLILAGFTTGSVLLRGSWTAVKLA
jgi:hypothetical protein